MGILCVKLVLVLVTPVQDLDVALLDYWHGVWCCGSWWSADQTASGMSCKPFLGVALLCLNGQTVMIIGLGNWIENRLHSVTCCAQFRDCFCTSCIRLVWPRSFLLLEFGFIRMLMTSCCTWHATCLMQSRCNRLGQKCRSRCLQISCKSTWKR